VQNNASSTKRIFLGVRTCAPHRKSSRACEDGRGTRDLINACMDFRHGTSFRSVKCTCSSKEKKLRQIGFLVFVINQE
jgi:hypothetical protein